MISPKKNAEIDEIASKERKTKMLRLGDNYISFLKKCPKNVTVSFSLLLKRFHRFLHPFLEKSFCNFPPKTGVKIQGKLQKSYAATRDVRMQNDDLTAWRTRYVDQTAQFPFPTRFGPNRT